MITPNYIDDSKSESLTDGYMPLPCSDDYSKIISSCHVVFMCELCRSCLSDNARSILNHILFFFLPLATLLFLVQNT